MAITATTVGSNNTLEQFRVKFNNLVTDVTALEAGTLNFGALSASSASVGDLTVTGSFDISELTGNSLTINGSNIVLEGSTANDNETTLTVTDPTADRTITFPDATGTVMVTGATIDLGSVA